MGYCHFAQHPEKDGSGPGKKKKQAILLYCLK
jgi:hypothetical protein